MLYRVYVDEVGAYTNVALQASQHYNELGKERIR
jgi:hypothetical protein